MRMRMQISEVKQVEGPTLSAVKKRWPRLKVRKMNGMGSKSWPDRCFWIPGGKPFLIEFKAPGKDLTELQAKTIKELIEDGYDVEVHDNKDRALRAISQRMAAAQIPDAWNEIPAEECSGSRPRRSRTR